MRPLLFLWLAGCVSGPMALDPTGTWARDGVLFAPFDANGERVICVTHELTVRLQESGRFEMTDVLVLADDPVCQDPPGVWTQTDRGTWFLLEEKTADYQVGLAYLREERTYGQDHPQAGDPPEIGVVETFDWIDMGETPSGDAWLLFVDTGLFWEVR